MKHDPDKATLDALGQAIRRRRVSLGLSQEQFAVKTALHRTYIGAIERGERNLSLSNFTRIAVALDLRPSELLTILENDVNERK